MKTLLELGKKFPMAGEYLLHIYLIQRDYRHVSNSRLAERMNVSRSAVSQAVKRLENLELVHHRGGNFILTDRGREFAVSLLRRHYLIEHLLVNVLEYPWDKADEEASLLQDKISADFTGFLFEKMGRPNVCPHGNPFPDIREEARLLGSSDLLQIKIGSRVKILRITEEGEEVPGMLSFCYRQQIRPGKDFLILDKSELGVFVRPDGQKEEYLIPEEYAGFLRVELLPSWETE